MGKYLYSCGVYYSIRQKLDDNMAKKEKKDPLANIFPQSKEKLLDIWLTNEIKKLYDPNCNIEQVKRSNGSIIFRSCKMKDINNWKKVAIENLVKRLRENK